MFECCAVSSKITISFSSNQLQKKFAEFSLAFESHDQFFDIHFDRRHLQLSGRNCTFARHSNKYLLVSGIGGFANTNCAAISASV